MHSEILKRYQNKYINRFLNKTLHPNVRKDGIILYKNLIKAIANTSFHIHTKTLAHTVFFSKDTDKISLDKSSS